MMVTMRRVAWLALLVATGCKAKPDAVVKPEVFVTVAQPAAGTISSEIEADATLAPLAQAAISPKITAPVKRFYVQRGSKVVAGQMLAVLENADLSAAVLDNKGTYTAAQGTFETETKATVPEDTTKAELEAKQAESTLALDQSIVTARAQLFTQGAIPGRDLDTAKATLVQAQAAYELARQHLVSVQQVSRKSALQTAQGQLESARGKYLGAAAQLGYTEIRSPIAGVVTDRSLFAGETAAAGTPLLTVMDTTGLLAKLHVAQVQAQMLVVGGAASVTVPGVEEPVAAKVALISPALDPGSTTVEVWLRIENAHGALKVGTPVHVTITGRSVAHALLIPAGAVQVDQDASAKFVMVMTADGTAHKRAVKVGIATAEMVQILDGISAADTVITVGGYGLDEGTKVKAGKAPAGDAKKDEDDK